MTCNDMQRWFCQVCLFGLALAACTSSAGGTTTNPQATAGVGSTVAGTGIVTPTSGAGATPTAGVTGSIPPIAGTLAVAGATQPAAGTGGESAAGTGGVSADSDAGPAADSGTTEGASGASAAGSSAAGSAAAGSGGTGSTMLPDLGKGDGSDVITIGDSWMNIATNGGGIEGGLDRAGTMYRHYSIAGTTLINGDIPQQYVRAKAANPKIATVIMTGGGNDIMFSNGCATADACAMSVQKITDALDQLWTMMAADGVTSVLYIQYSDNAGTTPMNTRPTTSSVPPICLTGKIRCLGAMTTDLVAKTDLVDGIHPTLAGCDRIAKRVLDTLAMNGARR